jgi:hypothetical protein
MEQDQVKATATQYGPTEGGKSPCVIVRRGEDPEPTCVNPQCPRQLNCRRHIHKRTDKRTPTIAIITYADCTWYQPIKKEKKNGKSAR